MIVNKVAVLCAHDQSTYYSIPGAEVWNRKKDAFLFSGSLPVIAHPPCAQWSKMRSFSNYNLREKLLAEWCWDIVNKNGGIFEHPAGSLFWKYIRADRSKIFSVDQCWWGFPGRKTTYLYFHNCTWLEFPIMYLPPVRDISSLHSSKRSVSTLSFNTWLFYSALNKCGN